MAFRMKIDAGRKPALTDSKLGGLPYWNFGEMAYPTDSEGSPMQLLAQVNLSELDGNEGQLPRTGLLQFFIAKNDMFGLDLKDQVSQADFRVVFHEKFDEGASADAAEFSSVPNGFDSPYTPVSKECAISFEEGEGASGILVEPQFTQEDPRELLPGEEAAEFDSVLFQMDSSGNEEFFMWGDEGIGNFFANSERLKAGDFSKILYNWDCC